MGLFDSEICTVMCSTAIIIPFFFQVLLGFLIDVVFMFCVHKFVTAFYHYMTSFFILVSILNSTLSEIYITYVFFLFSHLTSFCLTCITLSVFLINTI